MVAPAEHYRQFPALGIMYGLGQSIMDVQLFRTLPLDMNTCNPCGAYLCAQGKSIFATAFLGSIHLGNGQVNKPVVLLYCQRQGLNILAKRPRRLDELDGTLNIYVVVGYSR